MFFFNFLQFADTGTGMGTEQALARRLRVLNKARFPFGKRLIVYKFKTL